MQINLAAILGHLVKTEREARGLSQKELANYAHLHPVALSKIERGAHQDLGVATLSRLSAGLSHAGPEIRAGELLLEAESIKQKLVQAERRDELPKHYRQSTGSSAAGALIAWLAFNRTSKSIERNPDGWGNQP